MKRLETAMIDILEHGILPRNPLIHAIIKSYQFSKIGTGGMGFNWETGNWGTMPKWIVEAFLILDIVIANHSKKNKQITQEQQQHARYDPFNPDSDSSR